MADTRFILVVEDDPILKNLLGHTFAGRYQTLYASNGAEALALFNQYTPAIVLLDLMLPDMDGFSVLQQIRSRADALKDVPIIIVSNLGQQADKDRAISLGANDYIVKAEVEIEEIVNRLEKLIGPSTSTGTTPAPRAPTTLIPIVDADPTALHMPSDVALEQMLSATPNTPSSALASGPMEGTEEKPFVI